MSIPTLLAGKSFQQPNLHVLRSVTPATREKMFAVDGWHLGEIVAQTPPTKKLKRKRGGDDNAREAKAVPPARPTTNPFAMRKQSSEMDQRDSAGPKRESQTRAKKKTKNSKHSESTKIKPSHQGQNPTVKHTHKSEPENHIKSKSVKKDPSRSRPKELEEQTKPSNQSLTSFQSTRPDTKLTPLQQKMRAKLAGSQFRHINEKLYTTNSSEALSLFTEHPSLFHDYHDGFRHQVQSWPTNPIDIFIDLLSKSGKSRLAVADMGCGDAALARHFKGNKRVTVHSYDLVKVNDLVQVCDMANVPLPDSSVDVAVFCLSLMGTNFLTFIREACRYTKLQYAPFPCRQLTGSGEIWIAEIKSRFLDPSFESFVKRLKDMGLRMIELNKEEKMFVIMRFERVQVDGGKDIALSEDKLLKACFYKKR